MLKYSLTIANYSLQTSSISSAFLTLSVYRQYSKISVLLSSLVQDTATLYKILIFFFMSLINCLLMIDVHWTHSLNILLQAAIESLTSFVKVCKLIISMHQNNNNHSQSSTLIHLQSSHQVLYKISKQNVAITYCHTQQCKWT